MTPAPLRAKVVGERARWVREMLAGVRGLPLAAFEEFEADARNPAAAESYLRRALEALLDLGRHALAKGFGVAAGDCEEIASRLSEVGVLSPEEGALLRDLAGYRNRMVYFYHKVSRRELYGICTRQLGDIEAVLDSLLAWLTAEPGRLDREL